MYIYILCSILVQQRHIYTRTNDSTLIFLSTPSLHQLSFLLEMRDRSGSGPLFHLIDRLNITVSRNVTGCSGPSELVGDEGVATFLLSYQLVCTNLSVCITRQTQPTPSNGGKWKMNEILYLS